MITMRLIENSASWLTVFATGFVLASPARGGAAPTTICYSTQPNPYFNDHAADIKKIYDGFFFTIGSWEDCAQRFLGAGGTEPKDKAWLEAARANLEALRKAGVTENFLTVYFSDSGEWPSAATLLSEPYTRKMAAEFSTLGTVAKQLGFRGVCVDVEYPYLRYSIDHKIYTYTNYTVGDLLAAAGRQGYECAAALLDAFPAAPVIILPGYMRGRPIGRAYMLGMLKAMADRDAPGGYHLGTEYTYCLHDPVTALATTRFEDPGMPNLTDARTADYWRRRCTIAPGVWPTHMIETGGKDYPMQQWKQEIAELRQQMAILRAASKRYVWSFSGLPSWYVHTPELEKKYGLTKQDLKRPDIDLRDWHQLLRDKPELKSSPLQPVLNKVRRFDRGRISGEELCDAFGTPGRWWVLGRVGNPHTQPQFAAVESLQKPINPRTAYHGRDGLVRWFAYDNLDARGVTQCMKDVFGFRNTDNAAAHFVSFVHSPSERSAFLHTGWSDGILIKLGDQVIFDASDYPPRGKGMLYLDKHQFEKRIAFTLPKGKSQLSVTSLNLRGKWEFSLRITDENDIPFQDVRFRLE
ncbi:MAG: hypothetical protein HY298_05370 [Verrucomicrobia bacterium]|nr:hypothetical protein [Verrucomicrobiota bacterium]